MAEDTSESSRRRRVGMVEERRGGGKMECRGEEARSLKRRGMLCSVAPMQKEQKGVVAIVGVGPGLGFSIARRFSHGGYTVAILARNADRLERIVKEIAEKEAKAQLFAIRIDCSKPTEIIQAFESVRSLGFVQVLVYNVGTHAPRPKLKFTDIKYEELEHSLTLQCLGAFQCVQQVLPGMIEKKRGTIIFTGAMASVKCAAGDVELGLRTISVSFQKMTFKTYGGKTSCSKSALKALSKCLAREYQPQGIHVVHVNIDGIISSPRLFDNDDEDQSLMNPDAIAETYWHLHTQDQSAWTQEIDLQPFCEIS